MSTLDEYQFELIQEAKNSGLEVDTDLMGHVIIYTTDGLLDVYLQGDDAEVFLDGVLAMQEEFEDAEPGDVELLMAYPYLELIE